MLPSPVISQVVYYFVYFFAGWEHDKSDLIGQFRGLQQIRESDWSVYGMHDYGVTSYSVYDRFAAAMLVYSLLTVLQCTVLNRQKALSPSLDGATQVDIY